MRFRQLGTARFESLLVLGGLPPWLLRIYSVLFIVIGSPGTVLGALVNLVVISGGQFVWDYFETFLLSVSMLLTGIFIWIWLQRSCRPKLDNCSSGSQMKGRYLNSTTVTPPPPSSGVAYR